MAEFTELDDLYEEHFRPRHLIREYVEPPSNSTEQHESSEGEGDYDINIGEIEEGSSSSEDDLVKTDTGLMIANGCGCGKACIQSMDISTIQEHVDNLREMTKDEREMYIMGALQKVSADHKRSRYGERKRTRYEYKFHGNIICRKSFMIIYDIKESSLKSLIKHLSDTGNVPRVHGNKGRKPSNALCFPDIERAVKFVVSYAQDYGLPQPAAPRGRDNTAPIYLPASSTKKEVHQHYIEACTGRQMSCKTFCKVWNHCCSHIKIAKPEDDVCAKCETLRRNVGDTRTEEDKLQTATQLQQHILSAKMEHKVYRSCIDSSRTEFRDIQRPLEPVPPCSTDYQHAHYTFDFSQSVCIPHHSRQMGPMYFLTARKVHIFGFRDDGIPCQYNYVVDEAETMDFDGKGIHGPNAVISMVHHALGNFSHGERSTTFHADNCGGQNKNKYVLAYFAWRTMTGLNTNIKYLMQIPGHARCLVDAGFAHIKKLYRRSDCETVDDIERLVNLSAKTNVAVRYRNGNTTNFDWRDWKSFLGPYFKPVKGIRQHQQFEFKSDHPGQVVIKTSDDSEEVRLQIVKGDTVPQGLPDIIPAAGLYVARQQYLHANVRKYLRECNKDTTCPHLEE